MFFHLSRTCLYLRLPPVFYLFSTCFLPAATTNNGIDGPALLGRSETLSTQQLQNIDQEFAFDCFTLEQKTSTNNTQRYHACCMLPTDRQQWSVLSVAIVMRACVFCENLIFFWQKNWFRSIVECGVYVFNSLETVRVVCITVEKPQSETELKA